MIGLGAGLLLACFAAAWVLAPLVRGRGTPNV